MVDATLSLSTECNIIFLLFQNDCKLDKQKKAVLLAKKKTVATEYVYKVYCIGFDIILIFVSYYCTLRLYLVQLIHVLTK